MKDLCVETRQGKFTHQLLPCHELHPCQRRWFFTNGSNINLSHSSRTSMGYRPLGTGCFSMSLHGVMCLASKPAPAWSSSSMGSHILPGAFSTTGFSCWILLRLQVHLCIWISKGCRGIACLTRGFTPSCRGILAPASGSDPPPRPSQLTWVPAELFPS